MQTNCKSNAGPKITKSNSKATVDKTNHNFYFFSFD